MHRVSVKHCPFVKKKLVHKTIPGCDSRLFDKTLYIDIINTIWILYLLPICCTYYVCKCPVANHKTLVTPILSHVRLLITDTRVVSRIIKFRVSFCVVGKVEFDVSTIPATTRI